jgi:hypothetical protein
MIARWWLFSLALVVLTGGCASPRLADDTGPTPADVIAGRAGDGQVHWGGRIVGIENLRDRTRLEVLAFPLASDGEPLVTEAPQGRFIVERPGFLEPHDYAPDRIARGPRAARRHRGRRGRRRQLPLPGGPRRPGHAVAGSAVGTGPRAAAADQFRHRFRQYGGSGPGSASASEPRHPSPGLAVYSRSASSAASSASSSTSGLVCMLPPRQFATMRPMSDFSSRACAESWQVQALGPFLQQVDQAVLRGGLAVVHAPGSAGCRPRRTCAVPGCPGRGRAARRC